MRLAIGVVAGLLSSCSAGPPPLRDGTTFALSAEGSFQIERVVLVVDGRKVIDRKERHFDAGELARLALLPGPHRVGFMLTASYVLGRGRCHVDVGATHVVTVSKTPALLSLSVKSAGAEADPGQRALATITAANAEVGAREPEPPEPGAATIDYSDCTSTDYFDATLCRMHHHLDEARRMRDIIRVNCDNDKITQLEVTKRSAGERRIALAAAKDEDDANHQRAILTVLEQRAAQLWTELEQCVGEDRSPPDIILNGRQTRCP